MLSNNWDIVYDPSPDLRNWSLVPISHRAEELRQGLVQQSLGFVHLPRHLGQRFAVVKNIQMDRAAHGEPFPVFQYNRWMVDRFRTAWDAVHRHDQTLPVDPLVWVEYQIPPLDVLRWAPDSRMVHLDGLLKYGESVFPISRKNFAYLEPGSKTLSWLELRSRGSQRDRKLETLVHALKPHTAISTPPSSIYTNEWVLTRGDPDAVYAQAMHLPRLAKLAGGEVVYTSLQLRDVPLSHVSTLTISEYARISQLKSPDAGVRVGGWVDDRPSSHLLRAMLAVTCSKRPEMIDDLLVGEAANGTTVSFAARFPPSAVPYPIHPPSVILYVSDGNPLFDRSGKLKHGIFLTYESELEESFYDKTEYRGMQRAVGRVTSAVRDVAEQLRREISRVSYGAFTFSSLRRA